MRARPVPAGRFAESPATQTLIIFASAPRAAPPRSEPSRPLLIAALTTVDFGVLLPLSPMADLLGFAHLPIGFFLALVGMVVGHLVLIELAERLFYADPEGRLPQLRRRDHRHAQDRRAAPFGVALPRRR